MPSRLRLFFAALLVAAAAGSAGAADIRQTYDVSVGGISAGRLSLAANTEGARYTARGEVAGGGIVGFLVDFYYGGVASGVMGSDGIPRPQSYRGERRIRGDSRVTQIRYEGGVPVSVTIDPPRKRVRPWDILPRDQRGTVDPVSATYAVLADQPVGRACGRRITIYDGARRSEVRISDRRAAGNGWTCAGVYRRLAGFPPEDMAERTDFAFTIHYREVNGEMRVTRFETDTILGRAIVRRR